MTLVIDASAAAELLLTRRGKAVATAIATEGLVAPDLIVPELLSVLRGWVRGGRLDAYRAEAALQGFAELGVALEPMLDLAAAAWSLSSRASCYDAMYLALAQAYGSRVLTCDARLARGWPELTTLVTEVS